MFGFLLLLVSPFVHGMSSGSVKQNTMLPFPISIDGTIVNTQVALDANWRWWHIKDGYENCFDNGWVNQHCPDTATCSNKCVIDGVPPEDWVAPYGVYSLSGENGLGSLRLNYVTEGPYSVNVGSRMYLVSEDGTSYKGIDYRNKEFRFTVDVSNLPCGLNGAIYTIEAPLTNPYDSDLDASFGVNYGDAQCFRNIKYVHGDANVDRVMGASESGYGACSQEFDIWEANSRATTFVLHPCRTWGNATTQQIMNAPFSSVPTESMVGIHKCESDRECGKQQFRHEGVCDRDGADFNANRVGRTNLYGRGPSFQIDTTRPFDVITQFLTDDNNTLNKIKRYYEQDGKRVEGGEITPDSANKQKRDFAEPNHFSELGGFEEMSTSFSREHVLVLSLWDDSFVNMKWLDSVYPIGSTNPFDYRGPCSNEDTTPSTLRSKYPNSYVVYSNIRINTLDSTPTPPTTPPPSECRDKYEECNAQMGCCNGFCCEIMNDWYAQCVECAEEAIDDDEPSDCPIPDDYTCEVQYICKK